MHWVKKKLIYAPGSNQELMQAYGILPTPEYNPQENLIRVYFGATCKNIHSRVFHLDVDADSPDTIVRSRLKPILDIGQIGTFDDSGVVPSCVLTHEGMKYLFYVGFQRAVKVPYMLYSGMAQYDQVQDLFVRKQEVPVIDRGGDGVYSNGAPCVIRDGNMFKMWFWLGKKWVTHQDKLYLRAVIGCAESTDAIHWKILTDQCIEPNAEEFSVGRPWILKDGGIYRMWYSRRVRKKLYRMGYAESSDGLIWNRKDQTIDLDVSPEGWDSKMVCYPAVIKVKERLVMFYNGNGMGKTGFGYAVCESW